MVGDMNGNGTIELGDIAAIGAAISAEIPRCVGRSKNTPANTHKARVVAARGWPDFSASAH
jgi:enamidase